MAPALYGEELKYDFVITDPLRDDLEWKLIKAFVDRKKPIFGICRGVQVLNAYFGGTLYQDIPDELGGEHAKGVCHPVTLKKDSILGRLFGESLEINSYHHQALKDLGKDLTAVAWSDANGHSIVEAVEHVSLPIWAVQWHPERMTGPAHQPGKLCGFPAHLPVLYGSVQKIRVKKNGSRSISAPFFYSFFLFRLFCGLGLLYFLLRNVLCHVLGTILALCLWHCQVRSFRLPCSSYPQATFHPLCPPSHSVRTGSREYRRRNQRNSPALCSERQRYH